MKTYGVELKRTSYIFVTVEAENEDDAEKQAWKRIEADGGINIYDSSWDIESIEEITNEHDSKE
jgi:hypothetical protein